MLISTSLHMLENNIIDILVNSYYFSKRYSYNFCQANTNPNLLSYSVYSCDALNKVE